MVLRSRSLGSVTHGFSLRTGGVSTGRYESLNLSFKWGDRPEQVEENRRRYAASGGFALERLYTARQIHGDRVLTVGTGDVPTALASTEADALVSAVPGVALAVGTADCVPILLADPAGRVAAIHAGWRGTVADIVGRAVEALTALGARPAQLSAALGPCICLRCFEVGAEVAERFRELPGCVDTSAARPHVDLRRANRLLLERTGIPSLAIDDTPPCTMCEPERFFSFRRDGAAIGQHLSFIVAGAT